MQKGQRAVGILVGAGFMLLGLGCAQPRPFDDLWVEARSYHSDINTAKPPADVLRKDHADAQANRSVNPEGTITLHDAVALALKQNPALEANGWSAAAAEADATQLGRPRNPTATLSVENFGGPDTLHSLPRQTLRISQVIELAGKRHKRQQVGQAQQRLAAWDYEAQRIEVAATTAARYVAVRVAQDRVALTEQQLKLASAAYDIANDRATNGTRPGYERDQAAARVALIEIEREQAKQGLNAARADLAASWGAELPTFDEVAGDLGEQVELPSRESLQTRLAESPQVARWADEIALREKAIALQRANGVTDPSIGGGVRYLSELDESVGVAEVSWPLPLLDNNEHAVLAARLRLSRARAQQEAAQTEASRTLARTYARAQAASMTLKTLKNKAIPASQAAYDATWKAYDAGQTEYLTALDAERSLLALQSLHLDAALAYHTAIIELEQITASSLNEQP